MRVNSLMLIASGMAGGLLACLVLRFVWASLAGLMQPSLWRRSSAGNEALYVGTHALMGGGIGLLFWLSWGFTALAGLTWWQQGLGFGLINALVFGLLPMVILRSLVMVAATTYWLLIGELLFTCCTAGLAASWAWNQAF
jgi:hypothetical protein